MEFAAGESWGGSQGHLAVLRRKWHTIFHQMVTAHMDHPKIKLENNLVDLTGNPKQ